MNFSEIVLGQKEDNANVFYNILWTDEAIFQAFRFVYKHEWYFESSHARSQEKL